MRPRPSRGRPTRHLRPGLRAAGGRSGPDRSRSLYRAAAGSAGWRATVVCMRRLPALLLIAVLAACGSQSGSVMFHGEHHVDALDLRGPGGLTFDEEVGAVLMVGFRRELTPAILDDWREHQYGGLLVVNENGNPDPAGL